MAKSGMCILGFVIFAQASAQSLDWQRYTKWGGYADSPVDGKFSDYRQYVQRYSTARTSSEKHAADDHASVPEMQPAQKDPAQKDSAGEQEASPLNLFAAALTDGQNVSDPVGEAKVAQREASQRAQAIIEELRRWDAMLKQDLETKNFSMNVAQGIVTKVQTRFIGKREDLQHSFNAAVEALDPNKLAKADASVVNKAEDAASNVMEEFKHLDHAEAHAMRSMLHSTKSAGKDKVRTLREEAKEASHQAYMSGIAAAEAQRKAGAHRGTYEGVQRSTQRSSENLERAAEEAAERVERGLVQQFREEERHLEKLVEDLDGKAREAREARRKRLHHAGDLIHKARRAVQEEAAQPQPAQSESAIEHATSPKAPRQEPAEKRPTQKGSTQEVPAKKDDAHKEPVQKESANQHVASPKASQQDPAQKASPQQESAQEGPVKKDSAQKQPSQKEHASEHVASMLTLLAEDPANEQNASDPVGEAQAAQREASQRAEAIIKEIQGWDAELKQLNEIKDFSLSVGQGIVTEVQAIYSGKRAELQHSFNISMEALNATTLAVANSSEVTKAEDAVTDVMDKLEHLDHLEATAMHSMLESIEKGDKEKAQTLWKKAKEAAQDVYRSGMAAAMAQKKAGVREHMYERVRRNAEKASERLSGRAEETAEKAKERAERQFLKVEHQAEKMMDHLSHKARAAQEARMQRFRHSKDLVEHARQAAQQQATRQEPTKQEASPGAFLAARAVHDDDGVALLVPLACACVMAVASASLAFRSCHRRLDIEHPLLG